LAALAVLDKKAGNVSKAFTYKKTNEAIWNYRVASFVYSHKANSIDQVKNGKDVLSYQVRR